MKLFLNSVDHEEQFKIGSPQLHPNNCQVNCLLFLLFQITNLMGWLLAAVCCLSVLYGNYEAISLNRMPSSHETALYNAMHANVWALGVGWLIWACCTGYGGNNNHGCEVLFYDI